MDRFIAHRVIKGANVYVQPEEVVLYSDVKRLEAEIDELKETLDQCLAYIRTGDHKCLDMSFISKVAKEKE